MSFIRMPALSRHYYGWVIVFAALIGNVAAAPLSPVMFAFFVGPMSEDLGWSRSTLSWAITCRLAAAALTAPLIGTLIDKFGARWLGVAAGVVTGTSIMALFLAHDLWLIYLLFALSGAIGLGGGPAANLITQVPVAKWFIAKRGRATAISMTGLAGGAVIGIPLCQWLIVSAGWRTGWLVFGFLLAILIIPTFGLLMRRSPEDLGLLPDGLTREPSNHTGSPMPDKEIDWTTREALTTPALWIILGALFLLGLALSGTLVHRVAFWSAEGLSPTLVAIGTAADPFTVIFSAIIFGLIGERVSPRILGLVGGGGFALSMLPMILSTGQVYQIFAHNIIWGMAAGAYITVNNLIWPHYFGTKSLGTIRGIAAPVSIIAVGLGAPLFGYLFDGGLTPSLVWAISLAMFATSGVLVLSAKRPRPQNTLT